MKNLKEDLKYYLIIMDILIRYIYNNRKKQLQYYIIQKLNLLVKKIIFFSRSIVIYSGKDDLGHGITKIKIYY